MRSGPERRQLRRAGGEKHIRPQADKLNRKSAIAVDVAGSRTMVESNIAPELREASLERRDAQLRLWIALGDRHQHVDASHWPALLRARRERSIGRATETTGPKKC
jgi:hypothetical protein